MLMLNVISPSLSRADFKPSGQAQKKGNTEMTNHPNYLLYIISGSLLKNTSDFQGLECHMKSSI